MNKFQRDVGLVSGAVDYHQVVAMQFREFWN
jgi:hypothetical protein